MNVLGIDDNPDILQMLEMTVESLGHSFDSTTNGITGLEKIRSEKFDLAFLDLSMPDFTGLDVIDSLNDSDVSNNTNIVLFTASYLGASGLEKDSRKNVIHSILKKPADIDQIIDKINEIESLVRQSQDG